MSLIQVKNLTFAYEGSGDNIFEDVNFQIDTDWKLGFTGRNGRGKTTFLKLLLGEHEYRGKILSSVEFEYFPYKAEEEKNGIEIAFELNPMCELWELEKEIFRMNVAEEALYRPFSTLSYGERTKVLLAVLFLKENAFLLIDEPTNHLDQEARESVARYLNTKKGFILVSHDRAFLDACTDHILAINKTDIEVQKGNFSSWYENKRRKDNFELQENQRLKKDIRRLAESSRQAGKWAADIESTKIGKKSHVRGQLIANRDYIGEKSRRMEQRRKNLERRQEKAIEDKKKLLKNVEEAESLKIMPEIFHSDRLALFSEVTFGYGEKPDSKPSAAPLSFSLFQGERIVLEGGNGCGKSTALKLFLEAARGGGQDKFFSRTEGNGEKLWRRGEIETAFGLKISYIPQSAEFLSGSLREFAKEWDLDETLFLSMLRKLDFSREQFDKKMEDYSQGQKKKVLLAKSLCEKAHLYLWDEPLNYIDIFTRMQLEETIEKYSPTMILVEHDKAFTDRIATKRIRL